MHDDIRRLIVLQVNAVIDLYAERNRISRPEAETAFLASETCRILKDSRTGLWGESEHYILNSFEEELRGVPRAER